MKLTKRQVRALIKATKEKGSTRFEMIQIKDDHLYVTNGRLMIQVKLNEDIENGAYHLNDLIHWSKLSSAKDRFTEKDIKNIDEDKRPMNNLERFFENNNDTELSKISFDPKLFNIISEAFNNDPITMHFNGEVNAIEITSNRHKDIKAILLPMRLND